MIWTEMLMFMMSLKLMTQSKFKLMKIINMTSIMMMMTHTYNNINMLLKPTSTYFMQLWMMLSWNISMQNNLCKKYN